MKRFKLIYRLALAALAVGAVFSGCSVTQEEDNSPEGREIRFTASVGTFQVKATDTAFEVGDAVGLFADTDFGEVVNMRMVWNGQNFRPDETLYWGVSKKSYGFAAYYPYNPERNTQWAEFCVNSDQSSHELLTASDLMMASTVYEPTNEAVDLNFSHVLSQVLIHIDNQLDEQISEVFMSNVLGVVSTNVYAYKWFELGGIPGTIKTCPVQVNGSPAWAVIVPPQECEPAILITTVSGKQYKCTTEEGFVFDRGCRYHANITLDSTTISTEFSSEVTDWTDNKDLMFYTNDWALITSYDNWSSDWWLYEETKGVYVGSFYGVPFGTEFKFRMNGKWDVNLGIGDGDEVFMAEEGTYPVTYYGAPITLPCGGDWDVVLNTNEMTVTFTCVATDGSRVIWKGEHEVHEWTEAMDDLSWGGFDWSSVMPGTILHLDVAPLVDVDWWCVRIGNGSWVSLPGLPENLEQPGTPIEIILSNAMIDELVINGGLVIAGEGFKLRRVALLQDWWDYTPSEEYLSDKNLWKAVDAANDIEWYYNPVWNGEMDGPAISLAQSTYTFFNKEYTNGYWQAQIWIKPKTDLILDPDKTYTFSCTLCATGARRTPAYLKLYQKGVDETYSFEARRFSLEEYVPYTFKVENFVPIGTPQQLLLDFGGIEENVRVYIKDIVLKEDRLDADGGIADLGLVDGFQW